MNYTDKLPNYLLLCHVKAQQEMVVKLDVLWHILLYIF